MPFNTFFERKEFEASIEDLGPTLRSLGAALLLVSYDAIQSSGSGSTS
jgi:hypothetical protein